MGIYLSGMAILAAMNATPTFMLLTVLQVQLVAVLTVLAPPITTIPLVGSVISMGIVLIVSLFHSPPTIDWYSETGELLVLDTTTIELREQQPQAVHHDDAPLNKTGLDHQRVPRS